MPGAVAETPMTDHVGVPSRSLDALASSRSIKGLDKSSPSGSEAPTTRAKSHRLSNRPPFECIALLLQGGGALGSYQAGVYEALAEADLHPDWVAGISIGAINSAIIAG